MNENNQENEIEVVEEEIIISDSTGTSSLNSSFASKKRMKVGIAVALVLVVAGLVWQFKGLVLAAMVNGRPISRWSVVHELESHNGQEVLDLLVNKKLITLEARDKKISVSNSEVDDVIKKYESIYTGNGQTLDDTLKAQNLTRQDLKEQIIVQKQVEKLLSDKVNVSDEEVKAFMDDNKVSVEAGKEAEVKAQVEDELRQQKLSQFTDQLIKDLRAKAKIRTFVKY